MTDTASLPLEGRAVYGRAELRLPTGGESAAADAAARQQHGVPERVLMENAARAAALVLERVWPRGRVVGVAGSGNNGGDLAVLLRVLRTWGRDVALIAGGSRGPDPALLLDSGIEPVTAEAETTALLAGADVIVDGLLGTGSRGAPRGRVGWLVDAINAAARPVLALDLPTGVDADTGQVPGAAVAAAVTVMFGWPKLGLLLHPARARCGRLVAVEIGFPEQVTAGVQARALTPELLRQRLRRRAPDAHKGSAGRLLVCAGSAGMAGAAALAVEAAIRAGAGLVRVASHADNRLILQSIVPEATFLDRSALTPEDAEPMHALVAGPGLGTDHDAQAALQQALRLTPERPALLDADALNILSRTPDQLERIADARPLVITPHARELARLTGMGLDTILADAPAAARNAARRFGCTVLLKGQPSLVAEPDGTLHVNTVGSSDVATAGMGDQLAGVAGALLAGGAAPAEAAGLALLLSGRAADIAALGRSLTPRDVSRHLARALADPGPAASPLDLSFITFDQPARW